MSGSNPIDITLGPTAGVLLLAVVLAGSLWGIFCMQVYLYFLKYPKDQLYLKLMVIWLWALSTVDQVMLIVGIYTMLVINFGNFRSLQLFPVDFVWRILTSILTDITAKCFFTYRIWMFSGKRIVFLLVLIPAILATAGTSLSMLIEGLKWHIMGPTGLGSSFVQRVASAGNAVSCATDFAFAGIMIYLLKKHEIKGNGHITQMVHRLTLLSIMSGAWTAVVSIAVIVTLTAYPENSIWAALSFLLGPLYCNTVVANLNARTYVRGDNTIAAAEVVFDLSALQQSSKLEMDRNIIQNGTLMGSRTDHGSIV